MGFEKQPRNFLGSRVSLAVRNAARGAAPSQQPPGQHLQLPPPCLPLPLRPGAARLLPPISALCPLCRPATILLLCPRGPCQLCTPEVKKCWCPAAPTEQPSSRCAVVVSMLLLVPPAPQKGFHSEKGATHLGYGGTNTLRSFRALPDETRPTERCLEANGALWTPMWLGDGWVLELVPALWAPEPKRMAPPRACGRAEGVLGESHKMERTPGPGAGVQEPDNADIHPVPMAVMLTTPCRTARRVSPPVQAAGLFPKCSGFRQSRLPKRPTRPCQAVCHGPCATVLINTAGHAKSCETTADVLG